MYDLRRLFPAQHLASRAALCGFGLVAFSLTAWAGTDLVVGNPAYSRFVYETGGKYGSSTAGMFYLSGGTALPSASTLAQHASVAGLSPTAGEVTRYASFNTKYGQVPFKVAQTFAVGRLASGAAALALNPAFGLSVVAATYLYDWYTDAGIVIDSATGVPMEYPDTAGCQQYPQKANFTSCGGYAPATAYLPVNAYFPAGHVFTNNGVAASSGCYATDQCTGGGGYTWKLYLGARGTLDSSMAVPSSQSSLESKLSGASRTTSEIEKILSETIHYPEISPAADEPVRITPPTTGGEIKSPSKSSSSSKTNSDGSTVEEVKSCWMTGTVNTGASMTLKEVCNTDTTVKGTSGNVISTATTVTTSEDAATVQEEETDFCASLLGKLVCADLDTPEAEPIDKTTKTLTYATENHFGGGACPADAVMTTHNGQSLKVWDWAGSCDKINQFFRPLFMSLCAFTALMILAPAVKEA